MLERRRYSVPRKAKRIKLSLLENAFDYILNAVQQLQGKRPSKRRIKYGIVHLWSGVELLIKKRLMDEHWSLIFRDINKADRKALNSGDFVSVYFDEAVTRLKNICGIDISDHNDILKKIREDRNRLEHFGITLSKEAAVSNIVKAWNFVLDFTSAHIDLSNEAASEKLFEKIRRKIIAHEEFVKERLKVIDPEIQKIRSEEYPYTIIDCPECLQETLLLKGGDCECLFCKMRLHWKDAMEEWLILHEGYYRVFNYEDRSIEPLVLECPECGYEGLYRFADGDAQPPDPAAICFHCGSSFLYCEWCSLAEVCPNDQHGICKECSIYLIHKKGKK